MDKSGKPFSDLPQFISVLLMLVMLLCGCRGNLQSEPAETKQKTLGSLQEYCGEQFLFYLPQSYQQIKTEADAIALTFKSSEATLRVFKQAIGENLSAEAYIEYGNAQLYRGKAGFEVLEQKTYPKESGSLCQISYKRPELTALENDFNYYTEVHLLNDSSDHIITFWGKSTKENFEGLQNDLLTAGHTVRLDDKATGSSAMADTYASVPASVSAATSISATANGSVPSPALGKEPESKDKDAVLAGNDAHPTHIKYNGNRFQLEIQPQKLVWGRYFPGVPFNQCSVEKMLESESRLGHKFEFLMTYVAFPGLIEFPEEAIRQVYQDGRLLMLTLQPNSEKMDWIVVPEIINGQYDTHIKEWAKGLKKIGEPIFVRPLDEMNGDWDPWCALFYGKDADLYIHAWRHIVDIFREVRADNVFFVWNPLDRSYPNFQWNNAHLYYPGDDYVDWIGLSGFNNGTGHVGEVWREFDEIFRPLYAEYAKWYPDKPVMITEFACNEEGGNKARWIEKAMASIANNNYPNLKIAVWYDNQLNVWHYELDSSEEAFVGFQKGLGNIGYLKKAISISQ